MIVCTVLPNLDKHMLQHLADTQSNSPACLSQSDETAGNYSASLYINLCDLSSRTVIISLITRVCFHFILLCKVVLLSTVIHLILFIF